jgi:hypothetical protein
MRRIVLGLVMAWLAGCGGDELASCELPDAEWVCYSCGCTAGDRWFKVWLPYPSILDPAAVAGSLCSGAAGTACTCECSPPPGP